IIDTLVPLLDPEQNNKIQDEFLQIPLDYSKVLFIATANNKANIPDYILDRFQVLEMNKYDNKSRSEIIQRYMIGEFNEILRVKVSMTPQAGMKLAKSGISLREAKRYIEEIISKKLMRTVDDTKPIIITENDVVNCSTDTYNAIGFRR
ncbi:MAG: hypothetical protein N3E37_05170, partial [Candidatus Micrarchaeota archaeon]|nr:hypothetical protein [Candidatus Micrarchaeota archaeon]